MRFIYIALILLLSYLFHSNVRAQNAPPHPMNWQQQQVLMSYKRQAGQFMAAGQYQRAHKINLKAYRYAVSQLGAQHPWTAFILWADALCLWHAGSFRQAEPKYQRARSIIKKYQGYYPLQYFSVSVDLGRFYVQVQQYKKAINILKIAIRFGNIRFRYHALMVQALNQLSLAYQAIQQYTKALQVYNRLSKLLNCANMVLNIQCFHLYAYGGDLLTHMRKYRQASTQYKQAERILKSLVPGKRHPFYANVARRKALLFHHMKQQARACKVSKKAVKILSSYIRTTPPSPFLLTVGMEMRLALFGWFSVCPKQLKEIYKTSLIVMKVMDQVFYKRYFFEAQIRIDTANLSHTLQNYDATKKLLLKAKTILSRILRPNHPQFVRIETLLNILPGPPGARHRILSFSRKCASNRHRRGQMHILTIQTCFQWAKELKYAGELYASLREFKRLLPLARKAAFIRLEKREQMYRWYTRHRIRYEVAEILKSMGKIQRARKIFNQLLLLTKQRNSEITFVLDIQRNLASINISEFKMRKAIKRYRTVVKLARKHVTQYPALKQTLFLTWNDLSMLRLTLGQPLKTIVNEVSKYLEGQGRIEQTTQGAILLGLAADIYDRAKLHRKALVLRKKQLDILKTRPSRISYLPIAINGIAETYKRLGQNKKYLLHLNKYQRDTAKHMGQYHVQTLSARLNYCNALLTTKGMLRKSNLCLSSLLRSTGIYKPSSTLHKSVSFMYSLSRVMLLLQRKQTNAALLVVGQMYRKWKSIRHRINLGLASQIFQYTFTIANFSHYHYHSGIKMLSEVWTEQKQLMRQLLGLQSHNNQLQMLTKQTSYQSLFYSILLIASTKLHVFKNRARKKYKSQLAQLGLERILHTRHLHLQLQSVERTSAERQTYSRSKVYKRLQRWRRRLVSALLGRGKKSPSQLKKLQSKVNHLERQMSARSVDFAFSLLMQKSQPHAIAQTLTRKKVLIEIVKVSVLPKITGIFNSPDIIFSRKLNLRKKFGQSYYIAFCLQHKKKPTYLLLGKGSIIDGWIRRWRREVLRTSNRSYKRHPYLFKGLQRANQKLTTLIWKPIQTKFPRIKKFYIVPDGSFHLLPVGALKLKGKYLAETHEIAYLSSGRDLLRKKQKRAFVTTQPMIVGIQSFGSTSRRFSRLTNAGVEASEIGRLLGVAPILNTRATKKRILLRLRKKPKWIHFATHGYFYRHQQELSPNIQPLSPNHHMHSGLAGLRNSLLRSGLALANANKSGFGGLLTAQEIALLDLRGVELVVLSACDTGRGQSSIWQGVAGLRSSFMRAGAKRLVMSLWKVSDSKTPDLMKAFYKQLKKRKGQYVSSFSAAQQQSIRVLRKKKGFAHPYFWAGFLLQGY